MKKILIFGATGKIGIQTLEIIVNFPKKFVLVGFSFFNNLALAKKIQKQFSNLKIFSPSIDLINNVDNYEDLIKKTRPDLIVNAIIGFSGLEISFLAIDQKINLALANKETIAICGNIFLKKAQKNIKIFPIDSEHSALYELLKNQDLKTVKEIFITASGGKYYSSSKASLKKVKYKDAIQHPIWDMGSRISIDSSTLINKFFEVIEAFHYFQKPVKVLYHPQAVVHAGILKNDHGYCFHFSKPDMKYSINLALNEFINEENVISELDFSKMQISFDFFDSNKWLPLKWAQQFMNEKLSAIPVIVNALDEELIKLFAQGKINFCQITEIINSYLKQYAKHQINNLKDILELDKHMRELLVKDFLC